MVSDALIEGITGGIGGALGRTAGFPFDTLRTRKANRPTESFVKLLFEGKLYNGLAWSALEATLHKFVYMWVFNKLRLWYQERIEQRMLESSGNEEALPGFLRSSSLLVSVVLGYFADVVGMLGQFLRR